MRGEPFRVGQCSWCRAVYPLFLSEDSHEMVIIRHRSRYNDLGILGICLGQLLPPLKEIRDD
jgi:hypothetical protein